MPPAQFGPKPAGIGQRYRSLRDHRAVREATRRAEQLRDYLEGTPRITADAPWPARWLRPKGHITRGQLVLLLTAALLPLLLSIARISAWPGVLGDALGGTFLPALGQQLNEVFSLRDVTAADRNHVLYLLFVPTGAVIIALTRLTFGIRLIGFRSILISVGFQQSGLLPSLLLIAVMIVIMVSVRPALVRMRLSYYPRVAVIMSISVLLMLGALVAAPWIRSEVLWNVAFFPVIVLGLFAEGIARTLDRDSALAAFWRTSMTICVAVLLAGLSHVPVVRETAIEFPELVVSQIVAIILIAEFLDLRLLQHWDARLSGVAPPRLFGIHGGGLRVAVVRNDGSAGIIGRTGRPSRGGYRRRTVRRIVRGLRNGGHFVKIIEGDMGMLAKLGEFMPPDALSGQPGGIVLNLSHGIQGELPVTHVPAMLEMAGLAYTGPTPLALMTTLDRVALRTRLQAAGIPTPDWRVIHPGEGRHAGLAYPVVVNPRSAPVCSLRIAGNPAQLESALRRVAHRHGAASVVENLVTGREIEVPILGNSPPQCLPLVEVLDAQDGRVCPARLDEGLNRAVRVAALAAYEACGCRDYALVNVRLSASGEPLVIEVGTLGILEEAGSFELAARTAGWSHAELVERVIQVARERYWPANALAGARPAASTAVAGDDGKSLVAG